MAHKPVITSSVKKVGRNPRSDRNLCEKGDKSLKKEIKVQIEKANKSPKALLLKLIENQIGFKSG